MGVLSSEADKVRRRWLVTAACALALTGALGAAGVTAEAQEEAGAQGPQALQAQDAPQELEAAGQQGAADEPIASDAAAAGDVGGAGQTDADEPAVPGAGEATQPAEASADEGAAGEALPAAQASVVPDAGVAAGQPVLQASPVGMGFVYVDKAPAAPGETQNVAAVLDGDVQVAGASLVYEDGDGQLHAVDAATTYQNAALFTFPVDVRGTYRLVSLQYAVADEGQAGVEYTLDLTADGDACTFEVTDAAPAAQSADEAAGADASFYALAEDGSVQEASSVAEALEMGASAAPQTLAAGQHEFVVALDPGHGGDDSGALGYGLQEKDLTWAITMACKEALEQYPGVRVVLTRSYDECPSIRERVERAYAQGANVVVSIHINAEDSGNASGAEVWYPNYSSWAFDQTTVPGSQLAQNILDKLVGLGLNERGTKVRTIVGDPAYVNPDGSDADYYGIIRYARQKQIVGVIAEHAFVTNAGDASLMSDPATLAAMGRADAQGIAQTYGLGASSPSLFGDTLPGDWFVTEGWISYVVEHGLMTGYTDPDGLARNFHPTDSLTRGQLATILYRAANPTATDTTVASDYAASDGFADTPRDASGKLAPTYYNAAVAWCAQKGIVTGYLNGGSTDPAKVNFMADAPVTREEMATMAWRFVRAVGVDVSNPGTGAFNATADADQVDAYAHDAMVWCAASGVMTGKLNGPGEAPTLDPHGTAQRAEAAKVVTVLFRDVLP